MIKKNIYKEGLQRLYFVVNHIIDIHPLWWEVFIEDIINNSKVTFINNNSIIIGLYELSVSNVIILYEILKILKKNLLIQKVFNKKEFLIIHILDDDVLEYLTNTNNWLKLVVYRILEEEYPNNKIYLKDELIFIEKNTVYYLVTNPKAKMASQNNHKYVYLYKNMHLNHVGLLDEQIKYYFDKQLFLKKFREYLQK